MPLTAEQRALRRLSIGGSDIGTIAGVNPHRSAFQLYLQKIGEDEDEDRPDSDAQMFGNIFEAPTAEVYALKHSVRLDAINETLVHPNYEFITANPDRVCLDLERLLEIKTTGAGGLDIWRNPDAPQTLRVPQHVTLQVNHYLGFLGWQEADVVLLNFAESYQFERYYEFPVQFDQELFDLAMQLAINFWNNHVLARVAPESEDAEEVGEYLKHTYKTANDNILVGGKDEAEIAARLANANKQFNHWKEQKAIESNSLKALIGDNAGIKGDDWVFSWKVTASGGVDWKAMAESKSPTPEEIRKFTRKGYRRQYFRYRGQTGD
jgi:putative phage-type endonuclease